MDGYLKAAAGVIITLVLYLSLEKQAKDMFHMLVEHMKVAEGVTEQLKEENQMEWVCRMQNIEARAREIVTTELIYK